MSQQVDHHLIGRTLTGEANIRAQAVQLSAGILQDLTNLWIPPEITRTPILVRRFG